MTIKYLKYMQKWVAIFNKKAIAIGNTNQEAIAESLIWLQVVKGIKHN